MKYKNKDKVKYKIEKTEGEALVVGHSMSNQPILGAGYILQDLSGNFPNDIYDFETFQCFECWMEKLNKN